VREFALSEKRPGETMIRVPVSPNWWVRVLPRKALVVYYDNTHQPEPLWLNSTVNIDTGCVYRKPLQLSVNPKRILSPSAPRATYYESKRPFLAGWITSTSKCFQQVSATCSTWPMFWKAPAS